MTYISTYQLIHTTHVSVIRFGRHIFPPPPHPKIAPPSASRSTKNVVGGWKFILWPSANIYTSPKYRLLGFTDRLLGPACRSWWRRPHARQGEGDPRYQRRLLSAEVGGGESFLQLPDREEFCTTSRSRRAARLQTPSLAVVGPGCVFSAQEGIYM